MSSPTSVLNGQIAAGEVTVADAGLTGMITLRGDLADAKLQEVCIKLTGAPMPAAGHITRADKGAIGWMSPDEVLLILPHADTAQALSSIAAALEGKHHLCVNVSDARALISVTGPFAREVIAKLAPADLGADTFKPGQLRRTRLGQVAAAFWMTDETTFQVICFRSVAEYTFNLLRTSAQAGPVGFL